MTRKNIRSPVRETWSHFSRSWFSVLGLIILAFLVVVAVSGEVLTEWCVVFDAETVRLPQKLLPPIHLFPYPLVCSLWEFRLL